MPKQAPYLLRWSPQAQKYELLDQGCSQSGGQTLEHSDLLHKLVDISSFAFYSYTGAHFTARKENIQRNGPYWYAYRSSQGRTSKRYLGRTADLSIGHLENIAESFLSPPDTPITSNGHMVDKPITASQHSQQAPSKQDQLLLDTKLRPPRLPLELVERPRLFKRLDGWSAYKLTLLIAPAGSGKTTLVTSWLAQNDFLSEAAWVSLDMNDNDPARFWRYVLRACQGWHSLPEPYILPLNLPSPQTGIPARPFEELLIPFLNEVAQHSQHRLLVLEDYHVITEARIHETFDFLLANLPETLHILLLTRTEPPLSLTRLRSRGEISSIYASDLRFSPEETAAFLQPIIPASPSTELLATLDTHLEGWAAGLRLLALSLQGHKTQTQIEYILTTFRGNHRSIRDYFVSEVLQAQPEPLQDFLLRTSILARLSVPLCLAVTGQQESASLLESIARANLFLEALDGTGEWYRYHALFAEAMQHEARLRLGEDELRTLYQRASHWFAEYDLLTEGIEAALKAKDSELAARLIEQYIEALHVQEFREFHTLRRWLTQLPEKIRQSSPQLCLSYAVTLIFGRDEQEEPDPFLVEQLEILLQLAEEGWHVRKDLPHLGQVFAFRALFSYQQGKREQSVSWARQALAWLPATEPLWRGMSLVVLGIEALQTGRLNEARQLIAEVGKCWQVLHSLHILDGTTLFTGMICYETGELRQAAHQFEQLIHKRTILEDGPVALAAHLGLAQVLYEKNDLDGVQRELQAFSALAQNFPMVPQDFFQPLVELLMARLEHAQGETDQAIERLANALAQVHNTPEGLPLYFYHEARSWLVQLFLSQGDIATAHYWFQFTPHPGTCATTTSSEPSLLPAPGEIAMQEHPSESMQASPDMLVLVREQSVLLMARLHLAQDEYEAALHLLNIQLSAAQEAGRGRHALQIKLLLAQVYAAHKQLPQAHQTLMEALKQGHIEGYRRTFLDEGERLVTLLRDNLPHLHIQPLRNYARQLIQAFSQHDASQSIVVTPVFEPLYEPLTSQEQRVLRLLATGRSNPDIARELIVSVNTIRSQVQSIYRKLQVNNRHAASELARQLHLL
ncbi:helix-turn-helix transcriptional regulator [Ktedonobacter sp. SOSP1-52]|uniref:LuxR C-terminal-related transcriptional regulator n=1 Tax=Ktedonobacter sp. SOSP1-52 TaxID=2778366 RepID=UPI0019161953|nr:LuxR C-terminal-related transcriptional regulator [Ktedonobacter sp. SOSP1-52]GHO69996.1 helix-turn-helix transcriptional regulator [Ktedonobacter sp. SOSP1-52]